MTAANEELHKELAEAKRAGKRQAAPFSKGGRSSKPKRPGRKPGMGMFSYRKPPSAEEITEPDVEVPVSWDTCPGCGGVLEHEGVRLAYVTDLPPIRRPQAEDFEVQAERLKQQLSYHLRDRPMTDADSYRLQNELGWHDDRGNLLRFLDDPNIEPTNNRAERALRPAVIARKVSHCSKSVEGGRCALGVHQRNHDVGTQWRRPACRGSALRCVQRPSRSLPFSLNASLPASR